MGYEIKYMDSSLADMVIIKEYPYGFPLYPGSETYRKLVAGDYIVLYRVIEEKRIVEVHAIWHGKMNILEHIKNLPT